MKAQSLQLAGAFLRPLICLMTFAAFIPGVSAQLIDRTLAPNLVNEGIAKSLEQQIGGGRGDSLTPDCSAYMIARDPFRAIRRGRQIFQRKFSVTQGVGPRVQETRT